MESLRESEWDASDASSEAGDVVPRLSSVHAVQSGLHGRIRSLSAAMSKQVRGEMKKQGMRKKDIDAVFQEKNHSRFSLLRMSTDTEFSSDGDEGFDVDDEEEEEEEEEGEEEVSSSGESEAGGPGRDRSDSSDSDADGEDEDAFMTTYLYMQEQMGGCDVDRYLERTRTMSTVNKPRALSHIEGAADVLEKIAREKGLAEKCRQDATKSMDGFLGGESKSGQSGERIIRERDLSDAEFMGVYDMTRAEFAKLNVVRRAFLRRTNMHKRPKQT
jgi:hypothetical protein